VWEDRRVRFDDAVLALFAAIRIARVAVGERASGDREVHVADLFSDDELRVRDAFRLSVDEAERRWTDGERELVALSVVAGVSALDDLLGATIRLLRDLELDSTRAGDQDTGVSAKLRHLASHGGLGIDAAELRLHAFCVALRNSVTHHGGSQRPVRIAWERLLIDEQTWWESTATRPLPLTGDTHLLRFDDRELVAFFKVLDRIALAVNKEVLDRVAETQWAALVYEEYRSVAPSKAANPQQPVAKSTLAHARKVWRLELDPSVVENMLRARGLVSD
jgi:hypothetical protein